MTTPTLPFDPYKILGITKDAQQPEIRSAHRKRVLQCHPDKVKDPSLKARIQDEFEDVQRAYELLSDETCRRNYDICQVKQSAFIRSTMQLEIMGRNGRHTSTSNTEKPAKPSNSVEPQVTKATLSELDVNKIVHNPRLRHDINFDPDLHFRPNLDGEKGRKKTQKSSHFWDTMRKELQQYLTKRDEFEMQIGNDDWSPTDPDFHFRPNLDGEKGITSTFEAGKSATLTELFVKRQSKWSLEEDTLIIQLRGKSMKWEDISKRLPGRSAISCRLHYQNYLGRSNDWDEERKNTLARIYER